MNGVEVKWTEIVAECSFIDVRCHDQYGRIIGQPVQIHRPIPKTLAEDLVDKLWVFTDQNGKADATCREGMINAVNEIIAQHKEKK